MLCSNRTKSLHWIYSHQIRKLCENKCKSSATTEKPASYSATDSLSETRNHNIKNVAPIPENIQLQRLDDRTEEEAAKTKIKGKNNVRPGHPDDLCDEAPYYFVNGLRKVYPYYITFTTYTKGHWVGETVLNVFAREFQAHSKDTTFIHKSIEHGKILVNNQSVYANYKLEKNDLLANTVHWHEMPVLNQPIEIIHMDDDIVAVNKPPSIPVHPIGRYRHNTAKFILAREYGLTNLTPLHRLDRLTSGVLLFGRNLQKVRHTKQQMSAYSVEKQYICRVEGEFPEGNIQCTEPVEIMKCPIGVARVSSTGKYSRTSFEKLSFNGRTSVVLCKPKTGRMHQIRVHLQFLGFPIINDPLYNHTVFGPLKGRGGDFGGKTEEQLIKDITKMHDEDWLVKNETCQDNNRSIATEALCDETKNKFDPKKMATDVNCLRCKLIDREPRPQELVMYLHALKYAGPGWSYETPLPEWARENWTSDWG